MVRIAKGRRKFSVRKNDTFCSLSLVSRDNQQRYKISLLGLQTIFKNCKKAAN